MAEIDSIRQADHAQLYELLIAELTDFAVFLLDTQGIIISWNPGVERVLGYSEADWLGQPVQVIFTPEDRATGQPEQEMQLAFREGRSPDIRWHMRKDGSRLFVDGVMVALRDDAGQMLGYSKVMRDVTERKQAEIERERLLAELQRSNEDLTHFASIAAHDLQAPLRAVKNYLQLLSRSYQGQLDKETGSYLSSIGEETDSMQQLIQALLQYAQAGAEVKRQPAPMAAVLDAVLAIWQPAIQETHAQMTQDPLPTLPCDRVQMQQLLQNLVGNALKYRRSEAPPRVHVSSQEQENHWLFSVQDNGLGIAPHHIHKVFAPLKRLHGAEIPGTGIGLAVCKKIVESHGGSIWVDSTLGVGSTFYFTIAKE